jgi:hypothetical protein
MKLRKLTVNLDQLMQASQESGKSVKWVSQQLGHRSATLTLDTYAHALPDEEYDLSYLPEAGAGTNRHSAGTNHKLRSVRKRASI